MDRDSLCEHCGRNLPLDREEDIARHETPELIKRIGGVWAGQRLQHLFQCEVAGILRRSEGRRFPGAQPVSFSQRHF